MVIWLLQACTSLHSLQGAKTIEPDTWEVALGTSLQQNNSLSQSLGVPVPQMVLSTRYGWKPSMDVGAQLYLGGGLMDVRYQFAEINDWTLAIAPSIGGFYAGIYGNVDLRIPIRAQRDLSERWSMTMGLTPMTQHTLIHIDPLQETIATSMVGGTLRMERTGRRVRWGFTVDTVGMPGRATAPTLNYGLDLAWKKPRKKSDTASK